MHIKYALSVKVEVVTITDKRIPCINPNSPRKIKFVLCVGEIEAPPINTCLSNCIKSSNCFHGFCFTHCCRVVWYGCKLDQFIILLKSSPTVVSPKPYCQRNFLFHSPFSSFLISSTFC